MNTIRCSLPEHCFPSVREAFNSVKIPFIEDDETAILVWLDSLKEGDKVFQNLKPFQVINRIPNMNVITRKAPLARIIQRISPYFPSLFKFMPKSYILPFKNTQLVNALEREQCKYIIKPDSGSLGQGIFIVQPNKGYLPDDTMAVAQKYIDSYLIDDTKFDLRIYALVTNVNPLTIYVYRGGLARFCCEKHGSNSIYSELTNVAINHNSKLIVDVFKRMHDEFGIDTDKLWKRIDESIGLTIIAASSFIQKGVDWYCPPTHSYSRCFQILGFDILLDKELNPYVLEVNYRPSLDTHCGPERRMKVDMVRGAFLIGAPLKLAQQALDQRRWGWTEETWNNFLISTKEIEESANECRQSAEKMSNYHLIWPSDDPEKKIWEKVYEKVQSLEMEKMPGITVPSSMSKGKNIEKAAECSNSNDPNQAEAINFLNEWSQDPSSFTTAFYLIQNSNSYFSRFYSSSLIKNNILLFWNQLDISQKTEYRETLFNIIFNSDNIDETILYNIINALCNIAIFDWPDEFSDFSEIFSIQDENNIKTTILIISIFLSTIDISNAITHVHRNALRRFVVTDFQDKIMLIITTYINNLEFANDVLTIYNCILRWGSTNDIINFDLFNQLINQLLTNEKTCEKTIECLKSIFLSRPDSQIAFGKLSPFLIEILSKGFFQNQLPITSNFQVIEFIIIFLKTYTFSLEIVLIYNQVKETNESLINEYIELFYQTMQDHEIDSTTIHDDIIHLCQVILSASSENIVDNVQFLFISFWNDIIRNIRTEDVSKQSVRPTSELYFPLLSEIRQSLFNILSFIGDDEDENDHQYYLESTISSIYIFNPDDFFDFLKAQPLSPQFCYALGAFELINDMSKIDNVILIITELLQNSTNCESPEFQRSLLFGISHCGRYFQSNHQLFSQFIEFIFNSLSENERTVSNAASRAFKFLVDNNFELFEFDYEFIIKSIIDQSEGFIMNLEPSASKRIFQASTNLINGKHKQKDDQNESENDEIRQKMFMKLFEPIANVISNIDQFSQETVETALDIISKSCHKSDTKMPLFNDLYDSDSLVDFLFYDHFLTNESLNYLLDPLSQLATNVIPNDEFSSNFIEHLLISISVIQGSFPFEEIAQQVDSIFNLMKNRGKIEDCFFKYFSLLRRSFQEMDSLYSNLHSELIQPYLSNENQPCLEMFQMIGNFSPKVVDVGSLTDMTIQAIKELDANVAESAIKMYQSIMNSLSKEQTIEFLNDVVPQLIPILIDSIVNLIHKTLFDSLVDLFRCVLFLNVLKNVEDEDQSLNKMLQNVIVESLNGLAKEPDDGLFVKFANYLLEIKNLKYEFTDAFGNLLIVLKKYSPCDYGLFVVGSKLRIS